MAETIVAKLCIKDRNGRDKPGVTLENNAGAFNVALSNSELLGFDSNGMLTTQNLIGTNNLRYKAATAEKVDLRSFGMNVVETNPVPKEYTSGLELTKMNELIRFDHDSYEARYDHATVVACKTGSFYLQIIFYGSNSETGIVFNFRKRINSDEVLPIHIPNYSCVIAYYDALHELKWVNPQAVYPYFNGRFPRSFTDHDGCLLIAPAITNLQFKINGLSGTHTTLPGGSQWLARFTPDGEVKWVKQFETVVSQASVTKTSFINFNGTQFNQYSLDDAQLLKSVPVALPPDAVMEYWQAGWLAMPTHNSETAPVLAFSTTIPATAVVGTQTLTVGTKSISITNQNYNRHIFVLMRANANLDIQHIWHVSMKFASASLVNWSWTENDPISDDLVFFYNGNINTEIVQANGVVIPDIKDPNSASAHILDDYTNIKQKIMRFSQDGRLIWNSLIGRCTLMDGNNAIRGTSAFSRGALHCITDTNTRLSGVKGGDIRLVTISMDSGAVLKSYQILNLISFDNFANKAPNLTSFPSGRIILTIPRLYFGGYPDYIEGTNGLFPKIPFKKNCVQVFDFEPGLKNGPLLNVMDTLTVVNTLNVMNTNTVNLSASNLRGTISGSNIADGTLPANKFTTECFYDAFSSQSNVLGSTIRSIFPSNTDQIIAASSSEVATLGTGFGRDAFGQAVTGACWMPNTGASKYDGMGGYIGNTTTGDVSGEWVELELPSAVHIHSYSLASVKSFNSQLAREMKNFPAEHHLMVSLDRQEWTLVKTSTAGPDTQEASVFVHDIGSEAKYLRIVVSKIHPGEMVCLTRVHFHVMTHRAPEFKLGSLAPVFTIANPRYGDQLTLDGLGAIVHKDLTVSGIIYSPSDARLKTNVTPIVGALDKVVSLTGCTYDKDGKRQAGLIAQQVREVLPESVMQTSQGFLHLSYDAVIPLLVEAIKELREQVAANRVH